VITTYGALVSDYKASGLEKAQGTQGGQEGQGAKGAKGKGGSKRALFGRIWRRVVLDEGHVIRNSRAKVSLAVSCLNAVARWSLTGMLFLYPFPLHFSNKLIISHVCCFLDFCIPFLRYPRFSICLLSPRLFNLRFLTISPSTPPLTFLPYTC
jgi:hypothetical protein